MYKKEDTKTQILVIFLLFLSLSLMSCDEIFIGGDLAGKATEIITEPMITLSSSSGVGGDVITITGNNFPIQQPQTQIPPPPQTTIPPAKHHPEPTVPENQIPPPPQNQTNQTQLPPPQNQTVIPEPENQIQLPNTYEIKFGNQLVGSFFYDNSGSFSKTFTVPDIGNGNYEIKIFKITNVVQIGSQPIASANFEIKNPEIILSPSSGLSGDAVIISGYNFPTNEGSEWIEIPQQTYAPIEEKINSLLEQPTSIAIQQETYVVIEEIINAELQNYTAVPPSPYQKVNVWIGQITSAPINEITSAPINEQTKALIEQIINAEIEQQTEAPLPKNYKLLFGEINISYFFYDNSGSFETTFTVPDLGNGDYDIAIYDITGGETLTQQPIANGEFKVLEQAESPSITLTPEQGYVNETINIHGINFRGSEFLKIYLDPYHKVAAFVTTESGTFNETFTVPKIGYGNYTMTIVDNSNKVLANTSFEVLMEEEPGIPQQSFITLTPEQGYVNDIITIKGINFSQGITTYNYEIRFEGNIINSFVYDGTGNFETTFKIPEISAGEYLVEVIDSSKINLANASFEVLDGPSITLTQQQAYAGQDIIITGSNFPENELLKILLDDINILELTSDENGNLLGELEIPEISAGEYLIKVNNNTDNILASSDFEVLSFTPIIELAPEQGYSGDTITIYGEDFSRISYSYEIFFDGTKISSFSPGVTGNFETTFIVPEIDLGNYIISIKKINGEEVVSTEFEVLEGPSITSITWVDENNNPLYEVYENTLIYGLIEGENCNKKSITYIILEDDGWVGDDEILTNTLIFDGDTMLIDWLAIRDEEDEDNPDNGYYIQIEEIESNLVLVRETPPSGDIGIISGIVSDLNTLIPIENAIIWGEYDTGNSLNAYTNEEGYYEINYLPLNKYITVYATAENYIGGSYSYQINLTEEYPTKENIDISLEKEPCDIASITWVDQTQSQIYEIYNNTLVYGLIEGTNCNEKSITYDIKERDLLGDDTILTNTLTFDNENTAILQWISEYQLDDGWVYNNEFYIEINDYDKNSEDLNVIEEQPEPYIYISPTQGRVEQSIFIGGGNFGREESLDLYFDNEKLKTIIANQDGYFENNFIVPELSPDEQHIVYIKNYEQDTEQFTILPDEMLSITPEIAYGGDRINLSGENYLPYETINLYLNDSFLDYFTADGEGKIESSENFFIISGLESANYSITVLQYPEINLNLEVLEKKRPKGRELPEIPFNTSLSQHSGKTNDLILLKAQGFPQLGKVPLRLKIYLDNSVIRTFWYDNSGVIDTYFFVPNLPSENYTMTIHKFGDTELPFEILS